MKYAAFLLGINVGKRTVKMLELTELMEKIGYKSVRTVLASGNVMFDAGKTTPAALEKKLEAEYEKKFGFTIGVLVRTMGDLQTIMNANPFKSVKMTKDVRRYVMFLGEKPRSRTPPKTGDEGFRVLKVTEGEVYCVLDLSKFVKTPDVMQFVRKLYGKKITTRNWNTIEKILAVSAGL